MTVGWCWLARGFVYIANQSYVKFLRLAAPKSLWSRSFLVEPGPGLPDTVQLVEGPLAVRERRFEVGLIVNGSARVSLGQQLVRGRTETPRD